MPIKYPDVRKARDRERFRKRTEQRKAQGLCPRCGRCPPASGRSVCASCADRRNRADRARDARLRAQGKPRRDPERARQYERERAGRATARRIADGMCATCGQAEPASGRRLCEPCAVKRREAERIRYREARAAGKLYGGRSVSRKRRSARAASRKHPVRPPPAGRGWRDLRAVPRNPPGRGSRAVSQPPCRRTVRCLRAGGVRGQGPLRSVCDARKPATKSGAEKRRLQTPVLVPARGSPLHGLQFAELRGVAVRSLRETLLCALRSRARHAGVSAKLRGDPRGDRGMPGEVRRRDGRGSLHRVREPVRARCRGGRRRRPACVARRLGMTRADSSRAADRGSDVWPSRRRPRVAGGRAQVLPARAPGGPPSRRRHNPGNPAMTVDAPPDEPDFAFFAEALPEDGPHRVSIAFGGMHAPFPPRRSRRTWTIRCGCATGSTAGQP